MPQYSQRIQNVFGKNFWSVFERACMGAHFAVEISVTEILSSDKNGLGSRTAGRRYISFKNYDVKL